MQVQKMWLFRHAYIVKIKCVKAMKEEKLEIPQLDL